MISYNITQHITAFPSKVKARECGHIYNIKLIADRDNGTFVKKGDWLGLDLYKEAAITGTSKFTGIIREQAANGEYYIEITECDPDVLFVYQCPMIAEDFTKRFSAESNFYNAKDEIVRCYELVYGDIISVSKDGITSSTDELVGKTVAIGDDGILEVQ